jgi:hypothetical protein
MWVIGMVVCMGLMLAGHALTSSGHAAHSHESATRESVGTAPGGGPAEAAADKAPQPEPGHHH